MVKATATQRPAGSFPSGSNYDQYEYLIVNSADAAAAAALPVKDLVYFSWEADTVFSIVSYATCVTNGWLALASGAEIRAAGFPTSALTLIGLAAYQTAWKNAVQNFLTANGNTGVFIDNCLADLHAYANPATYPDAYPNQAAWEAAMLSFITAVGPALKTAGFIVVGNTYKFVPSDPNSDNGVLDTAWVQAVAPKVSGCMAEYWLHDRTVSAAYGRPMSNSGLTYNDHWDGWQPLQAACQTAGAGFFPLHRSNASNVELAQWGRANFLLDWDGASGAYLYKVTLNSEDPYHPSWMMDIGTPSGAKVALGVGYRRDYTGGVVLVNPHATQNLVVALGPGYMDWKGDAVDTVTIYPTTGRTFKTGVGVKRRARSSARRERRLARA